MKVAFTKNGQHAHCATLIIGRYIRPHKKNKRFFSTETLLVPYDVAGTIDIRIPSR